MHPYLDPSSLSLSPAPAPIIPRLEKKKESDLKVAAPKCNVN